MEQRYPKYRFFIFIFVPQSLTLNKDTWGQRDDLFWIHLCMKGETELVRHTAIWKPLSAWKYMTEPRSNKWDGAATCKLTPQTPPVCFILLPFITLVHMCIYTDEMYTHTCAQSCAHPAFSHSDDYCVVWPYWSVTKFMGLLAFKWPLKMFC